MADIIKALIVSGIVDQVAVFDNRNIPKWADDDGWINVPSNVSKGFIDNGNGTFSPKPVVPPTPVELNIIAEGVAKRVLEDDKHFKAFAFAVLKEINILRKEVTDLRAEINSLDPIDSLQTKTFAPRTVSQLRNAIINEAKK